MNIDFNKIVDYIANGNITVIFLSFIIMFLILWIKYEESLKRLFSYLRYDLFRKNKEESYKEQNSFNIKNDLFINSINLKINKVESLYLSHDVGRNAFYHYLVKTMLNMMREKFINDLTAYKEGKITKEQFCSYFYYHKQGIQDFRQKYMNLVEEKLKKYNWSEEDIAYVLNMYFQWSEPYFDLLAELISTSRLPDGVIMAWWVFFYEIYSTLEKFSLSINGRITGNNFEKLNIGKPI